MEIKKTTKVDGKLKNLHFEGNILIDENGEIIDLIKYLKAAFEEIKSFDLSFVTKEEELVEINIEGIEEDEE